MFIYDCTSQANLVQNFLFNVHMVGLAGYLGDGLSEPGVANVVVYEPRP